MIILYSDYYRRQKSMDSDVFWIAFDRNKLETCGFQRLIAKTQEHIFISKIFSEKNSENRFFEGSLENHAEFLKNAIEIYWFLYIFGISIENWVGSCMFRIFSRTFFFVERGRSKNEFPQKVTWTVESKFGACEMLVEHKMVND